MGTGARINHYGPASMNANLRGRIYVCSRAYVIKQSTCIEEESIYGHSIRRKLSVLTDRYRPQADVRINLNLAPHVCLRTRLFENAKPQEPMVYCTGSRDFPTPTREIRISSETPLPNPRQGQPPRKGRYSNVRLDWKIFRAALLP